MPEAPGPSRLRRLKAEWPLLAAALALLSLVWLPRFLPSRAAVEESAVARLRELRARGDLQGLEDAAARFLNESPDSPHAGEVHALRASAALARPGLDAASASHAWAQLRSARRLGFRKEEMAALQRDTADALLDRGRSAEAVDAFRELLDDDPLAGLRLGRALAARAARRPDEAEALSAEILSLAAAARERLPAERKIEAVVAAARLTRRAGRPADAMPLLLRALDEFPAERGRIQLERGRSLASLDRKPEALALLDLAEELLKDDPARRDELVLAQLDLRVRGGLPAAGLLERLEAVPARRSGRLLLALPRPREAAEVLAELPSWRAAEDAGLDIPWIKRALRAAAGSDQDPGALEDAAAALRQLRRLEPEDASLLLEEGGALRRAGRFADAGEVYERAAEVDGLDLASQERAAKEGAEAYVKAERYAAAARLYERWTSCSPRRNAEGLLLRARCLRLARLPEAVEAYGEYVARARPGDPGLPEALLERGRLLVESGERETALAHFERLLTEDLGLSPDAAEWEAALLEKGRALLELRRADAARRALAEYLERYAEAGETRKGAVEAAYLLARAAMEQRDWEGALGALERALASDVVDPRAEDLRREARFLRGDLLLALGRYAEAERAYADASRRHAGTSERLWGVVGRARALVKLGRLEEARREARGARALFDEGRGDFETSFAGQGKAYWNEALESLEREVR
jgi:tetratricopeptide (TPR) repeat protein